jgi:hypothetical protein
MLYLSSTIAGGITNVRPVAPNHRVVIGYVEYAHAIHGKLYIKIDNGYELNELHDVFYATSALTNNQILSWSTGNTRWEARNETPTGIHNPVMIPGVVYTQSIGAIAPTTVTHSNGRLVLMPYIPCVTHTSTSLGLEVTTTAATANSRVLVYSDSNGVPFRKLVESTDLSSTSTGIKTFNTGFTFQRGTTYWIGTHTNAAVAFRAVPLANNLNIGITTGTFHLNMYLATVTFGSAPTFYSGASGSLASQIAPIIRIAI